MTYPIPARMAHLKRDPRGYAIPVITMVDETGRAHLTVNNEKERQRCLKYNRCHICGTRLFKYKWLVGSPLAAFSPEGIYIDGPLHHECMRYAVNVCPWLAAPSYKRQIGDKTLDPAHVPPGHQTVDPSITHHRPDLFVAVKIEKFTTIPRDFENQYIVPRRPILDREFWCKGVMLDAMHGALMSGQYMHRLTQERFE